MPPRMKIIVDLKMTGNTNTEIASLLKITEGTVRVQIKRAKDRLIHSIV
jgi:DNA-binding CsgD family transcriptional regulator